MPNFLVIGAGKSGTTSLYHYLGQHPEVYMSPVKEPRFFALEGERVDFRGPGDQREINRKSITSIEAYRGLFRGVTGERAIGEASPLYLYSERAPERIRYYTPDARLIAVLRNPVERAYSSYLHCVRDRGEPYEDFARALEEEEARIEQHWGPIWHYKNVGFYSGQLERYFRIFGREQIAVYLYEDLQSDTAALLGDMFRFLEVDDTYIPDVSLRHNISGVPRNRLLHEVFNKPNPLKSAIRPLVPNSLRKRLNQDLTRRNLRRPQLAPEVRRHLLGIFREDVLKLQDMISRDLSSWLRQ